MHLNTIDQANFVLKHMEGFVLVPGGFFIQKRYLEAEDDFELRDLSEKGASYLYEETQIHPDFTIHDFFLFMEKNEEIFSILFVRDWFQEVLEHYKDIKARSIVTLHGDQHRVESVELYWIINAKQGEHPSDKELREEIETGVRKIKPKKFKVVDQNGNSFDDYLTESRQRRIEQIRAQLKDGSYWHDQESDYFLSGYSFPECHIYCKDEKGKSAPYCMSFVGLERLLSARLQLSKKAELVREDKDHKSKGYRSAFYNPVYTLGHLIKGFLWEFSWHGSPGQTQQRAEELNRSVRDLRKDR